ALRRRVRRPEQAVLPAFDDDLGKGLSVGGRSWALRRSRALLFRRPCRRTGGRRALRAAIVRTRRGEGAHHGGESERERSGSHSSAPIWLHGVRRTRAAPGERGFG